MYTSLSNDISVIQTLQGALGVCQRSRQGISEGFLVGEEATG